MYVCSSVAPPPRPHGHGHGLQPPTGGPVVMFFFFFFFFFLFFSFFCIMSRGATMTTETASLHGLPAVRRVGVTCEQACNVSEQLDGMRRGRRRPRCDYDDGDCVSLRSMWSDLNRAGHGISARRRCLCQQLRCSSWRCWLIEVRGSATPLLMHCSFPCQAGFLASR